MRSNSLTCSSLAESVRLTLNPVCGNHDKHVIPFPSADLVYVLLEELVHSSIHLEFSDYLFLNQKTPERKKIHACIVEAHDGIGRRTDDRVAPNVK